MLRISILCVGKLKEKYLKDAVSEYEKRLRSFCKFEIAEVDEERSADNPNAAQIENIIECEGKRILAKLDKSTHVIAMCIEGKQKSSEGLAQYLENVAVGGVSSVAFVIGGSFGLSKEVKKRADLKLSMSEMTFPHQLARVMLCEQIYRAFSINAGTKYHK